MCRPQITIIVTCTKHYENRYFVTKHEKSATTYPKFSHLFFSPFRQKKPLRVTGGQPVGLPLFLSLFLWFGFCYFFLFPFRCVRPYSFESLCLGFFFFFFGFSVYLLLIVPFFIVMHFAGHPLFLGHFPSPSQFCFVFSNVVNFYS